MMFRINFQMSALAFDIETSALPMEQIKQFEPDIKAPGNYKDKRKIEEYIAADIKSFYEKAALSPITGRVLCIGIMEGDRFTVIEGDEYDILSTFWDGWRTCPPIGTEPPLMIGFAITQFDLPFVIKRSWAHNILVPRDVILYGKKWSDRIVDLMLWFGCGAYKEYVSLNAVARFFKVGEKVGSGVNFSSVYESDRPKAIAYLKNDLDLTLAIAQRMGVIL